MANSLRDFIGSVQAELSGDAPPTRFRIAAFGKNETTKGTFLLRPEDAKAMVERAKARKVKLSADYEHAAFFATQSGNEAPASAWYDLEVGDDGLYATNIEWTPRAAERLKAREYRYFSPWFSQRDDGTVAAFKNFALTNRPAMDALTPLVATDDVQPVEKPKMKTLLKHLALSEEATEAEALAKLQNFLNERDAVYTATGTKDLASAIAAIETAKQNAAKATVLAAELAAVKDSQEKAQKEALLSEGVRAGKVPPNLKDFLASQSVEFLKTYLEKAPVLVQPAGAAGTVTQKDAGKEQDVTLSDEEKEVARRMGVDLEKLATQKRELLKAGLLA